MTGEIKSDPQKPSVRTTVSLPRQDYFELEGLAEQKKVSVAWVVREAVEEYLQRQSPLWRQSTKKDLNTGSNDFG